MGSHSFVMDRPQAFVKRYLEWAQQMVTQYQDLLPDRVYQYRYDPYWVSAYPYRVDLESGKAGKVEVTIRNFRDQVQQHRIHLVTPPGIEAEPAWLCGSVPAHDRATYQVTLTPMQQVKQGISLVPLISN